MTMYILVIFFLHVDDLKIDFSKFYIVTQLNFDHYEAPDSPRFLPIYKKRKRKDPFRNTTYSDDKSNFKKSMDLKGYE